MHIYVRMHTYIIYALTQKHAPFNIQREMLCSFYFIKERHHLYGAGQGLYLLTIDALQNYF